MSPLIGILALQGDVEKHAEHLRAAGAEPRPVLLPADLDDLEGIVLPGGESTTISRLLRTSDLFAPLREFMLEKPVLATCAGMILLAREVDRLPYEPFGLLDISLSRNGWGRQIFSFFEDIEWAGQDNPMRAVFIRAPRVVRLGEGVDVLAELRGEPVAVRQEHLVALTYHPELTDDVRTHQWWIRQFFPSEASVR